MAFATSIPMSQPLFFTKTTTNNNIPSPSSIVIGTKLKTVGHQSQTCTTTVNVKAMAGGGLYSDQQFELTPQNVDTVLDDVRPYLIADGGNVDVVSVQDGVVSLKLQAVNAHLEILRPDIANFGGNVVVLSIKDGECVVKYTGPESIVSVVKATIKEKFIDIENVVFTE